MSNLGYNSMSNLGYNSMSNLGCNSMINDTIYVPLKDIRQKYM